MFNKAILIIGLVLIGTSLGVSSNERHQWKYKCIKPRYFDRIERTANQLGRQGWEMVNFSSHIAPTHVETWTVCFKQPM